MTFNVEGTEYRIEFRHINRSTKFGGRKLRKTGGFKGLTTCVVVFWQPVSPNPGPIVAIETVLCSEGDQFSKEEGRYQSLSMALQNCVKVPRAHIGPILFAYKNRAREVPDGAEVQAVQRAG